jgi:excinuclease ABC subunit C
MPVIGLAKEREEVWLPAAGSPFVLPSNSQALYLLQRLRDEAHRFAITYHRKLRAKSQTRSVLDELPGVGPARKRALLRVFGSAKQMRAATVDEIAAVPGISRNLAEKIHEGLNA